MVLQHPARHLGQSSQEARLDEQRGGWAPRNVRTHNVGRNQAQVACGCPRDSSPGNYNPGFQEPQRKCGYVAMTALKTE